MGLPARIAVPILVVIGALFLGVMTYFVRLGLGTPGTALGAGASAAPAVARATAAPLSTDAPGTYAIPQSGTGPATAAQPLPGQPNGQPVGGGAPPAPVKAMLDELNARLAKNPRDLAALVALANLEFDAGKYDKALTYYRRALALDPTNPDVRTDEATALHETGHDLDALRELDAVLATRPAFLQAVFNRGIVLRAIGRREDARSAFQRFVKLAPNDPRSAEARKQIGELG